MHILHNDENASPCVISASENCVDSHVMTSILEESRRMFDADYSGCLRVYFLVIEGLTETVSSCPKNYQPQTLDVLFALMRFASSVPGDCEQHSHKSSVNSTGLLCQSLVNKNFD